MNPSLSVLVGYMLVSVAVTARLQLIGPPAGAGFGARQGRIASSAQQP